jgi:glycosyltransferase involved in cell wall biosynthesis
LKRKLNICIVQPGKNVYSETFIQNHIKYLPGNIFDLYGDWFPVFDNIGERISDKYINRSFFSKFSVKICKFLPAFIANRITSSIKGYPYDENFNRVAFGYFLKKKKIDVVLAEFMIKGIAIKDVCFELNIPFIVHTHGAGDIMYKEGLDNHLKSFPDLFLKVSHVISVDSFSSSKLLEFGLQKQKLTQLGLGIDLNLFNVTKPSLNEPIFLAIGRLVNKKAPYLTILAFSTVLKKHPDAKLIMGGSGNLLDCCLQLVKALKIEKNVRFSGVLAPSEVAEMMKKSRAFVQHSLHTIEGDSEGIPVVILEAMACGLPVISTYHNGIADTITHSVDGLLVDENDVNKMAEYMIKLIDDPQYADQLGIKARQNIEEHFEMSKVIESLYCILKNAIDNNIKSLQN